MQKLKYVSLERIAVRRPVDRLSFIRSKVRHKFVLDLGALDETAYVSKVATNAWVHEGISDEATRVLGIDNSAMIPPGGLRPFQNSVIVKGDVHDLDRHISSEDDIDVVVAGELIEHLPNPLQFLETLGRNKQLSECELVLTTPNATSLHNAVLGMFGRESTHVDHLAIFSYKTLNTLCERAGFHNWEIIPYHVKFTEMVEQSRGAKKGLVVMFEKLVNLSERIFPLLSGGWIVVIRL